MSSRSSYGSSYGQDKSAYAPRSTSSASSYTSSSSASSVYAHSAKSSRSYRYGSKPPIVHNGGGQTSDGTSSTSAPNSGYYN